MHEYDLLFKGLTEAEQAEAFARKVKDISVFLDELGLRTTPKLQQPLKVAYHDACHLLHAQGVSRAPRNLLNSIENVTVLELNDGGLCCGSAGTYNLEQPEIAHKLGQRKVEHILNTGADAVASGNIGCLTQVHSHLAQKGQTVPLYHTIQVLDMAYNN